MNGECLLTKKQLTLQLLLSTMVKMDVEVVNLLINKSFYFCIFVSVTGRSCIVVQQNGPLYESVSETWHHRILPLSKNMYITRN